MINNVQKYPLIVGNWKLHGSKRMIKDFILSLKYEIRHITSCGIVIAPPVIYLDFAQYCLNNSNIMLSAQNVDVHNEGAFTGEISAEMIKDVGAKYIIIGHSERRIYHDENNNIIAKKFWITKQVGLIPILCIGENKEEYLSNKTIEVCVQQIDAILHRFGIKAFDNSVIAYEPLWAIGNQVSPDPDYVQSIHQYIRQYLAKYDKNIAQKIIIQYGGSVNVNNVVGLLEKTDINGVLIGGASLKYDIFSNIVKIIEKTKNI